MWTCNTCMIGGVNQVLRCCRGMDSLCSSRGCRSLWRSTFAHNTLALGATKSAGMHPSKTLQLLHGCRGAPDANGFWECGSRMWKPTKFWFRLAWRDPAPQWQDGPCATACAGRSAFWMRWTRRCLPNTGARSHPIVMWHVSMPQGPASAA